MHNYITEKNDEQSGKKNALTSKVLSGFKTQNKGYIPKLLKQ